ncbi:tryptase-2-like [Amia ocellicauda]|uniref:tryptase-2-like n=1 Tax=Amia ocellicauda TaxID=2972642 RepID=UPI003464E243
MLLPQLLLGCLLTLNTCGVFSSPLSRSSIIGGQDAKKGQWPWQVFLQISLKTEPTKARRCGGSLISEHWVLTAAHCFDSPYKLDNATVILGVSKLKDPNLHTRTMKKFIRHEKYVINKSEKGHDIALVELSEPVYFTQYIQPVSLPEAAADDFTSHWQCWATGWGEIKENVQLKEPYNLQEVQLPIIKNKRCEQMYKKPPKTDLPKIKITSKMMCAGDKAGGKDTCQGDSGGPLVCKRASCWVLAGITSIGYGCGNPEFPGVFTRVSSFRTWIKKHSGV